MTESAGEARGMTEDPTPMICEVLISGGGLVGLTFGIACAAAGLDVILVDRESPDVMVNESFDGRASAIAYGSHNILAALGIWDKLDGDAEAIQEIRVADNNAPLFLHYDHRLLGVSPLGYIVENRVLRRGLLARLREVAALRHLTPLAVSSVTRGRDGVLAELSDGRRIAARLAVAADGKASPLRRAAGIKTIEWSYPQIGIVTTVRHEAPHRGIAVEHFLPSGPFAILPMTGNRSSIVWTERAELGARMMALDESGFAAELRRRFGDFLGAVEPVGPRFSYKLGFLHAQRYWAERLVLVGDAAHVIHPIAGQGLNLGLRDVAALAEILVDTRRLGLDIGVPDVLARYQARRRLDTWLLAAVTDSLNRLFSNAIPPLRWARDLGLALVNQAPPAKRLFMRHAMGMAGDLPRLARGEPL